MVKLRYDPEKKMIYSVEDEGKSFFPVAQIFDGYYDFGKEFAAVNEILQCLRNVVSLCNARDELAMKEVERMVKAKETRSMSEAVLLMPRKTKEIDDAMHILSRFP